MKRQKLELIWIGKDDFSVLPSHQFFCPFVAPIFPSFRRRPESSKILRSYLSGFWTPAFAGVTQMDEV
jgi:hypothetical protein